jgi:hypothetical protein
MRKKACLLQGFTLIMVIFSLYHPTALAEAYWYAHYFDTSQGSRIRVNSEVSFIEWDVGRAYLVELNVTPTIIGVSVDRVHIISIELRWSDGRTEVTKTPKGPYELVVEGQTANTTFIFSPMRGDYGLIEGGQAKSGALYYRVNATESLSGGSSSPWNTSWQQIFDIQVGAPETADPMLIGAIFFLASFAFIALIGVSRRSD